MSRVVERCPNCGVEHDTPHGGACEVCGTPLRFWCRVHSREIGWLDGPECPRCASEAAARSTPPPPRRPPPAPRPHPRRVPPVVIAEPEPEPPSEWAGPPPEPYRDPREVWIERAEELRPYAETGAGVAVRMFRALWAVVRSVFFWGLLGALGGGVFAYMQGYPPPDVVWTALFGAMVGGGAGLFFGFIAALRVLFSSGRRGDG